MKNHIITVANKSGGYYEILKKSCSKAGCELTTLAFGEKWGGFVWRLQKIQEYIKTLDPNDVVIISDGFDVVMLEHIDEFNRRYKKFGKSIVIGIVDGPKIVKYAAARIFGTYKDYHLCAGLYVGKCSDLIEMFQLMDQKYDFTTQNDDQLMLTTFLNEHPGFCNRKVAIDNEMTLFANTSKSNPADTILGKDGNINLECVDGKVVTTQFGTQPCFIHGPGSANLKPYLEYLGWKNVPDIPKMSNARVGFYSKLFVKGLSWLDYFIYFIVLVIIVLTFAMIGTGISHASKSKKAAKIRLKTIGTVA